MKLWRPAGHGAFAPLCRACTDGLSHMVPALPDNPAERWDWHGVYTAPARVWAWWNTLPEIETPQLSLFAGVSP